MWTGIDAFISVTFNGASLSSWSRVTLEEVPRELAIDSKWTPAPHVKSWAGALNGRASRRCSFWVDARCQRKQTWLWTCVLNCSLIVYIYRQRHVQNGPRALPRILATVLSVRHMEREKEKRRIFLSLLSLTKAFYGWFPVVISSDTYRILSAC